MKAQIQTKKLSEKEINRRLSCIYDIALLAYQRAHIPANKPLATAQSETQKDSDERRE